MFYSGRIRWVERNIDRYNLLNSKTDEKLAEVRGGRQDQARDRRRRNDLMARRIAEASKEEYEEKQRVRRQLHPVELRCAATDPYGGGGHPLRGSCRRHVLAS
jgi:hypothetical protein